MTKRKYSDQEFIDAVKNNTSISGVLTSLNLSPTGGSYYLFHKRVKYLNLDTSHFIGSGHLKGKVHNWSKKIPLEEILVENSYYSRSSLRVRLIKENILIVQLNNEFYQKYISAFNIIANGIAIGVCLTK